MNQIGIVIVPNFLGCVHDILKYQATEGKTVETECIKSK